MFGTNSASISRQALVIAVFVCTSLPDDTVLWAGMRIKVPFGIFQWMHLGNVVTGLFNHMTLHNVIITLLKCLFPTGM